jgi:hypothetical protein
MMIEVLTAMWKKTWFCFFSILGNYYNSEINRKGLMYLDRSFHVRRAHTEFCNFWWHLRFCFGNFYICCLNLNVICYDTMWNKNWYCFFFFHLTYNFHDNIYNFTKSHVNRTIFQYYDYNYNGIMTEIVIFPLAESSV